MCERTCNIKGHDKVEPILVLTPEIKHYGKWVCGICSKFISWSKNPKTSEELKDRRVLLLKIAKSAALDNCDNDLEMAMELYSAVHLNYKTSNQWVDLRDRHMK